MSSAHRQLKQLKQQILEPLGLTPMQWAVLGVVYDGEPAGLSFSAIANELHATPAFITSVVSDLEHKDFVKRKTSDKDRRSSMVSLVKGVDKKVEGIEAEVRRALRVDIYSSVSRQELATFLSVLLTFAGDNPEAN